MQTSQNTEKLPAPRPNIPITQLISIQRNAHKTVQYTVCIDALSPQGNILINKMYRTATEMLN